jgi:hemoglobin
VNSASEITEESLARQVRSFYGRARLDPDLGPVFEAAVDDWEAHFELLTRFWASVMLGVRAYDGRPMQAHMRHPIRAEMFDRWLELWGDTAETLFAPEQAGQLKAKAEIIGRGLRLGLLFKPEDPSGAA